MCDGITQLFGIGGLLWALAIGGVFISCIWDLVQAIREGKELRKALEEER